MYNTLAGVVGCSGRWEESIIYGKKSIRLNPFPPLTSFHWLGRAYFMTGQFDEAILTFKKALDRNPNYLPAHAFLAASYSSLGREAEANAAAEQVLRINPKFSLESYAKTLPYKNKADIERYVAALRNAGLPDQPPLSLPDEPSIAVLPFVNMSDDPKQEYFSDGITEDLITDLSKISGLFVIARNSTFTYKGKPVKVKQVAQELGVRYVLEGSVRKATEKVRINAQLIDASTGHHLWAERYDGKMGDIFALQDRITQKIVAALAVKLTAGEQQRSAIIETNSIEAYDAFLQGWEHYLRRTPDDFSKALPYFKNAIELDPNYGRAYAALALTYLEVASYGWLWSMGDLNPTTRIRAQLYLEKALKYPTSVAHRVASDIALTRRKHQEALAEAEKAIAMDPNDAESHMIMAEVLLCIGRPEEAITSAKKAMLLDPRNIAFPLGLQGLAYFCMEQFDEAVSLTERALKLNPNRTGFASTLAAAYAHLGRNQEARSALDVYTKPWMIPANLQRVMYYFPFKNLEDSDRFAEGLLRAGLPGEPSGYYKASEEHRLTGEEIKELFFGHIQTGLWAGRPWSISRTREGKAALLLDSKVIARGKSWIEGDMLCQKWEKRYEGLKFYISVFRNPEGTPQEKNEYILLSDWNIYGVSLEDGVR
jgi:TolB-like protein/Flp pilus assembly protein TadD